MIEILIGSFLIISSIFLMYYLKNKKHKSTFISKNHKVKKYKKKPFHSTLKIK